MLNVAKADVWAATCEDQPGGLSAKLDGLAEAGANLAFLLARRMPEEPGKGVIFLTPLKTEEEEKAGMRLGFRKTRSLHSVRVEGPDEGGVGARIMRVVTEEGINVRAVSAAAMGSRFVAYIAFDAEEDAERVMARLQQMP